MMVSSFFTALFCGISIWDLILKLKLSFTIAINTFPASLLSVASQRHERRSSDPLVFLAVGSYTLLIFEELQRETALILTTERYMRGWQLNYWLPIIQAWFIYKFDTVSVPNQIKINMQTCLAKKMANLWQPLVFDIKVGLIEWGLIQILK